MWSILTTIKTFYEQGKRIPTTKLSANEQQKTRIGIFKIHGCVKDTHMHIMLWHNSVMQDRPDFYKYVTRFKCVWQLTCCQMNKLHTCGPPDISTWTV